MPAKWAFSSNTLKHFHIIGKACNGIGHDYNDYFRECCSTSNLCGINEGDCDSDDECSGDLSCGNNNCPAPFPSNADCCKYPGTLHLNNYFDRHVCPSFRMYVR